MTARAAAAVRVPEVAGPPVYTDGLARIAAGWRVGGAGGALLALSSPPKRLVPTKAGWIYAGFMLVIVFIAYATSNNLLFLLFSAMLSMIVASGVLSEASMNGLRVARRVPDGVFALDAFGVSYEVERGPSLVGSYGLEIREHGLRFPFDAPFLPFVAPRTTERITGTLRFTKRGRARLSGVTLSSAFPFGIFVKAHDRELPDEVIVYPPLCAVSEDASSLLSPQDDASVESQGDGDDVSFVREHRPGESLRNVHWRKSAALGRFVAKVLTGTSAPRVLVSFTGEPGTNVEPGLSTAVSLLVGLEARGVATGLAVGRLRIPVGSGPEHVRTMLRALALYEESIESVPADGIETPATDLVVTVDGRGRIDRAYGA